MTGFFVKFTLAFASIGGVIQMITRLAEKSIHRMGSLCFRRRKNGRARTLRRRRSTRDFPRSRAVRGLFAAALAILCNALHDGITTSAFYAGDLIAFTTGLLITVLLLVLTLRAAKLPGTPLVNIGFAVCALLWCAGGSGAGRVLRRRIVAPGPRVAGGPGGPVLRRGGFSHRGARRLASVRSAGVAKEGRANSALHARASAPPPSHCPSG